MRRVLLGLALLAPLAGAAPAAPAPSGAVVVAKVAQMEQDYRTETGVKAKRLVPLTKLDVGDRFTFTVSYQNRSAGPVDRVVVTDPIASEVAYLDGSVEAPGAEVEFSVDGGHRFGPAATLTLKGADGQTRPATAADYTHIRWKLAAPLQPAQKGVFRYRVMLR